MTEETSLLDLLTKPDKLTARTPNIQPTAAPVSGEKPPQSRCALSRSAKGKMKAVANLTPKQAQLLKDRLESAGITVTLQDQVGAHQLTGASSIRVQVTDEDFEQASLIVNKFDTILAAPSANYDQQSKGGKGNRWNRLVRTEIVICIIFALILWLMTYLKR